MAQRITIDPVTRIEGHLRVDIEVDGGKVTKAWSSGQMYRGLENILKGRDPRDAWLFVQRICGVCTTVHALASVRSVENALGLEIPYNAQYPMNHARVTESGHVQEFDDTSGSERIHTYHRSGTFTEIDANGTTVNRIVGDSFEIMERNGNVLIRGTANITVMGDNNIYVSNDSNIDVLGNVNMTVGGSMKTGVTGDYHISCGGAFAVDASRIDHNSGVASGVKKGIGSATGRPQFAPLVTPNRHTETLAQYETPEDGDPDAYTKTLERQGVINNDTPVENNEAGTVEEPAKTVEAPAKKPILIPANCSMIPELPPSNYKLSPNFTIAMLNSSSSARNGGVLGNDLLGQDRATLLCNLKTLCDNCLEPVIKLYPSIKITSGFRNEVPEGGSKTSDHMSGSAVDFTISGFSHEQHIEAAVAIAAALPAWTQLLVEKSKKGSIWIHLSYAPKKGLRMQRFSMYNHKRTSPDGKFTTSTTLIT